MPTAVPGGDPGSADLVISGPDGLEAAGACSGERVALALRPLGGRFPQRPDGFLDYAAEVPGQGDRFAWLPSHRTLDEVAYRAVIIGFPIFATMIILGSWWAAIAWSRYWGWDPKETAALVTWLVYAVYLHARNQRAWAGRPAALLLVVGFGMVLVTYSGSLWFNGLHAYSGL